MFATGKASGVQGMLNGCGAAVGALFISRLPTIWASLGYSSPDGHKEGIAAYTTIGVLCVLTAALGLLGLSCPPFFSLLYALFLSALSSALCSFFSALLSPLSSLSIHLASRLRSGP